MVCASLAGGKGSPGLAQLIKYSPARCYLPDIAWACLVQCSPVAKRYFVPPPPPPLIAISCPYLEPARFARQNLSVEMNIKYELIINFVNFYQELSIPKKK